MSLKKDYKTSQAPESRKVRTEVVVALLVLLLIVAGVIYVLLDLRNNNLAVDNTKNQPISATIVDNSLRYELYQEDNFELEIPVGWQRVNNPEIIIDGQRYYPYRFQGVDQEQVGRRVDVYESTIPALIPLTKLLEVETEGNTVTPTMFSPQCVSFADVQNDEFSSDLPAEWQGHRFICRPSGSSNTVGAVSEDVADGILLEIEEKTGRFLVVWQDHGSREDNSIFTEIMKTFRLR